MTFDRADLANMETAGTLGDVITHEMGHVLGIGGLWAQKDLLTGPASDPRFTGPAAVAEYRKLSGTARTCRSRTSVGRGPLGCTGGSATSATS
jgi:hypothetical protein